MFLKKETIKQLQNFLCLKLDVFLYHLGIQLQKKLLTFDKM